MSNLHPSLSPLLSRTKPCGPPQRTVLWQPSLQSCSWSAADRYSDKPQTPIQATPIQAISKRSISIGISDRSSQRTVFTATAKTPTNGRPICDSINPPMQSTKSSIASNRPTQRPSCPPRSPIGDSMRLKRISSNAGSQAARRIPNTGPLNPPAALRSRSIL